jgi:hypothetical protein
MRWDEVGCCQTMLVETRVLDMTKGTTIYRLMLCYVLSCRCDQSNRLGGHQVPCACVISHMQVAEISFGKQEALTNIGSFQSRPGRLRGQTRGDVLKKVKMKIKLYELKEGLIMPGDGEFFH